MSGDDNDLSLFPPLGKKLPPYEECDGLEKLDRNFVTLKFLSYEKIKKNL